MNQKPMTKGVEDGMSEKWYCFACNTFVEQGHLQQEFDRGGMTGTCESIATESKLPKPAEDEIRSATPEELTAQHWNYKPGPRQAVAFMPQDDATHECSMVTCNYIHQPSALVESPTANKCPCDCHVMVNINKNYGKGMYCMMCKDNHQPGRKDSAVGFMRSLRLSMEAESPEELPLLDLIDSDYERACEEGWVNQEPKLLAILACRERQLKQYMSQKKQLIHTVADLSGKIAKLSFESLSAAVPVEERTAEMEQLMGRLRSYTIKQTTAPTWGTCNGVPWVSIEISELKAILDHIEPKPILSTESIQEVQE